MKKSVSKELAQLRHEVHTGMGPLENLKMLIDRASATYGDRLAIVEKNKNEIINHTSRELCESVYAAGTALLNMGFKGKHIAILGEGSFNWIVSFFAVSCGVGVSVPLDKDLSDYEISKLISKADCEAVFCSKFYIGTVQKHMQLDNRCKCCITMSGEGKSNEEIESIVRNDITLVNKNLSAYKRVQDVAVSFKEFPKTSTKKVIRQSVIDFYNEKNTVKN